MHLLPALAIALVASPIVVAQGFSRSCTAWSLVNGHYLKARCGDGKGGWTTTVEDLNLCVINHDNQLYGQDSGGYASSCPECFINGVNLDCTHCGGVDLDNFVTNIGGWLWCYGHRGALVSQEGP